MNCECRRVLHINFHDSGAKELCCVYYFGSTYNINNNYSRVYAGSSVGNILYITAVGIYVYVLNSKISAVKFTLASFKILS